ncbi:hypothetical protein BMS_0667 [Halobacteriovorax marinus SJ]|uniref:PilZ domain-containing protein n=2 Tax=Halobacteriovorax marinus TaxID=97084 RepID=E1X5A1_HALMS|nr:hypothetical protein BMS_0667 [Halobacteriovorax marinus SJ]
MSQISFPFKMRLMNENAAKKISLSDSLDLKQYQELNYGVVLRNDTSGISFLSAQFIKINELREDSVCLCIPKNLCQTGHNLSIAFFKETPKRIVKFPTPENQESITIIGKVIDQQVADEEKIYIEVKFTQYKANEWNEILNAYLKKQEGITSLIEEVKK